MERRSAAPLLFLRQLPRWLLPVLFAVLVFAGWPCTGTAGAVLLLLAAVLPGLAGGGVLAAADAPAAGPGRSAIVALVLVGAVIQALR